MRYELDNEYRFMSISLSQKDLVALNFAESVLQGFKHIRIFGDFSEAISKVLDAVEVGKQLKNSSRKMQDFIQPKNTTYPEGRKYVLVMCYRLSRITNKFILLKTYVF